MLLIIDNYDSFTYNLVQYFKVLGQQVEVARNDCITTDEIAQKKPKYIVISPGPCDPDKAGVSLQTIKQFSGNIPLLGVCLGHQCIGQAFGGDVIRAPQIMHGRTSQITHSNTGVFDSLSNPMTVTRYHSLVIDPTTLPECLEVTATTADDDIEQIMGIKHKTLAVEGVQFHPESILSEHGHDLLQNFLQQYR